MTVFDGLMFLLFALIAPITMLTTQSWRLLILSAKTNGPSLWHLLQNLLYYTRRPLALMNNLTREYDFKILRVTLLNTVLFLVSDPEDVAVVMKSSHMSEKPEWVYKALEDYIPKSLLTSTGEYWKRGRKLVDPSFHKRALDSYLPLVNRGAHELVEMLRVYCPGRNLVMNEIAGELLVRVSYEVVWGQQMKAEDHKQICENIECAKRYVQLRSLNPILFFFEKLFGAHQKILRALQNVQAKRYTITMAKVKTIKNMLRSGKTITSPCSNVEYILMKNGTYEEDLPVTNEQLFKEANMVAFAAYDTTTVAITVVLAMLALHPRIQQQVREEILSIFGDTDRPATMEDLTRMEHLERVIKESLRLFPPVPAIGREAKEDVNVNGSVIPKSAIMIVNIRNLHRNPRAFENPNQFDPDRFLTQNVDKIPLSAYLPFSTGHRNCVGRRYAIINLKAMASSVLRNYEVRPGEGFTFGDVDIEFAFSATFVNDIVLRVYPLGDHSFRDA